VLFIAEAATLAHAVRPAVLADALPVDEFEVFVARDPRFGPLVSGGSWTTIDIRSDGAARVLAHARRGQPLFDAPTLEAYVQDDLRLIGELSPRLVVGDLRVSLAISCALARLPFVNIINAQWSPYSSLPIDFVDNPLEPVLGASLAHGLTRLAWPLGSAAYCLPLNVVRLKHGLAPLTFDAKQQMCAGDYVAYPDVPELVPVRHLPAGHRYLGPVLWSPPLPLPAWWPELPPDKPVIYVNLGSSGATTALPVVLEALAELPVSVIAATAGAPSPGRLPANAYLADYLPGDQCVARACLTICNGGTMSGQQSLAAGVPVLGLVTHADQLAFARAVREAEAGEWLPASRRDPATIKALVQRMVRRDRYRLAAQRLAAIFATYDPGARFRQLVREASGA
jgi:UDP:flavonoid glycosyltransferase YjiC (YdhE family)